MCEHSAHLVMGSAGGAGIDSMCRQKRSFGNSDVPITHGNQNWRFKASATYEDRLLGVNSRLWPSHSGIKRIEIRNLRIQYDNAPPMSMAPISRNVFVCAFIFIRSAFSISSALVRNRRNLLISRASLSSENSGSPNCFHFSGYSFFKRFSNLLCEMRYRPAKIPPIRRGTVRIICSISRLPRDLLFHGVFLQKATPFHDQDLHSKIQTTAPSRINLPMKVFRFY